jgi:predicted phosphodiesterase
MTHEGLILRDAVTDKGIFLFHGHQGDLLCDRLWRSARFFTRYLWKPLQILGVHDPTSAATNYKKRIQCEKRILDWAKVNKEIVICGHTHRPMFAELNVEPYFNTGSCVHPRCITGIEIQHREITLIKWWITVDDDGVLRVKREILMGPEKLDAYYR